MAFKRNPPLPDTNPLSALVGQIAEVVQQARAAYGRRQLEELSVRLTVMFGKGFDVSNLWNMRQFYLSFPIRDAVRLELGWTHYRTLLRVGNPSARDWYLREAISQLGGASATDRGTHIVHH